MSILEKEDVAKLEQMAKRLGIRAQVSLNQSIPLQNSWPDASC